MLYKLINTLDKAVGFDRARGPLRYSLQNL